MLNETECKGSGNKTYAEPSNKNYFYKNSSIFIRFEVCYGFSGAKTFQDL